MEGGLEVTGGMDERERLQAEVERLRGELAELRRDEENRLRVEQALEGTLHELTAHQEMLLAQNEDLLAARNALEISYRNYLDLYDLAPIPYFTLTPKGVMRNVNLAGAALLGRKRRSLMGRLLAEFVDEEDRNGLATHIASVSEGRRAVDEIRLTTASGRSIPVQLESTPTRPGRGVETGIRTAAWDLSERKRMVRALRQSEEHLQRVLLAANDGVWTWDVATGEITLSERGYEIMRCFPGGFPLNVQRLADYCVPGELEEVRTDVQPIIEGRAGTDRFEVFLRMRDGRGMFRWLYVRGLVARRDADGRATASVGTVTDFTERKEAELELARHREHLQELVDKRTAEIVRAKEKMEHEVEERRWAEEELIRLNEHLRTEAEERKNLSRKLIELLEKDRSRVATLLHDHAGQILTTLKLDLEKVRRGGGPPYTISEEEMEGLLGKTLLCLSELKRIALRMHPSALARLGLVASLEALVRDVDQSSGLTVEFFHDDLAGRLASVKELALYRNAQEALMNVSKHAEAERVHVTLTMQGGQLTLSIEDDGRGFAPEEVLGRLASDRALGLMFMKERMLQLGGELIIDAAPGRGALIMSRVGLEPGELAGPP